MLDTTTPERWLHPDGELVARMAEADDTALNELQARHERTAYAVAIGICTDSVRAERAVTAAFLDVFRQAGRFVPGEITVLAWITSLTRRHAEAIASARS